MSWSVMVVRRLDGGDEVWVVRRLGGGDEVWMVRRLGGGDEVWVVRRLGGGDQVWVVRRLGGGDQIWVAGKQLVDTSYTLMITVSRDPIHSYNAKIRPSTPTSCVDRPQQHHYVISHVNPMVLRINPK